MPAVAVKPIPATAPARAPRPEPVRSYADLTFRVRRGDLVEFTSASRHDPARVNTTTLDLATGDLCCDCTHAETRPHAEPPTCWHCLHILAAWRQHEIRMNLTPARVSDTRLLAIERAARDGRDWDTLTACGDEWAARIQRRAAIAAARRDSWGEGG